MKKIVYSGAAIMLLSAFFGFGRWIEAKPQQQLGIKKAMEPNLYIANATPKLPQFKRFSSAKLNSALSDRFAGKIRPWGTYKNFFVDDGVLPSPTPDIAVLVGNGQKISFKSNELAPVFTKAIVEVRFTDTGISLVFDRDLVDPADVDYATVLKQSTRYVALTRDILANRDKNEKSWR